MIRLARARPAYRDRYLGRDHGQAEAFARVQLEAARPGQWRDFWVTSADSAALVDQCARYIVRQERPAESVRVQWLRRDGTWAGWFPRRAIDHRYLTGRGDYPAELAELAQERDAAGRWWYHARLQLGPKRGTVPRPAPPRPRWPAAELLGRAITGQGSLVKLVSRAN